jgi:hypothetical protein
MEPSSRQGWDWAHAGGLGDLMKTLVRGTWKGDSRAICTMVHGVGDLGVTVATSLLLSYNGSLGVLQS